MASDKTTRIHTQRCMMATDDDNCDNIVEADHLRNLLFQPIAGDSTGRLDHDSTPLPVLFTGMHFGILDTESIHQMAVVKIKSPSVAEQPECLSDLRMGASCKGAPNAAVCETCHLTHHNCPGHFGCIALPHPVINPLFVGLLASVLQTMCMHCRRLRISPWYVQITWPISRVATSGARRLQRIKAIANACSRQLRCQFCNQPTLQFKQQGLCVTARVITANSGGGAAMPPNATVIVPPTAVFAALICLPTDDLVALGFPGGDDCTNHPANTILSLLPVLPPISRPAMRTLNLKTGQPFVVEALPVVFFFFTHTMGRPR
jgi:DNA-directed RNA polymerase beta' subunit